VPETQVNFEEDPDYAAFSSDENEASDSLFCPFLKSRVATNIARISIHVTIFQVGIIKKNV
jgi:hypothetical protein